MWFVSLVGCFLSLPEKAPCTDPHLWYAPDGSGDTYFGCAPPEGWQEVPPDESVFAASTQTVTEGDTDVDIDTDPADIDTGEQTVTFPPRDTAPPEPITTGDTGLLPGDTGAYDPPDTALPPEDTGFDTGAPLRDTNDTGADLLQTGDTGLPLLAQDTGLLPQETGLLPIDDDDTGTP
jgi:hypothetical protein